MKFRILFSSLLQSVHSISVHRQPAPTSVVTGHSMAHPAPYPVPSHATLGIPASTHHHCDIPSPMSHPNATVAAVPTSASTAALGITATTVAGSAGPPTPHPPPPASVGYPGAGYPLIPGANPSSVISQSAPLPLPPPHPSSSYPVPVSKAHDEEVR